MSDRSKQELTQML